MITKHAFFALLTANAQHISNGSTVFITARHTVGINNPDKPNVYLSSHRTDEKAGQAADKYAAWLAEWRAAQAAQETAPAQDTPRPQYGSHQEIVQERIAQISTPAPRRRMFDLMHEAVDAVVGLRPCRAWLWQSCSNPNNFHLLGWIVEDGTRRARLECTPDGDLFWWRDESDGARGASFPQVVDAVRDYFGRVEAQELRKLARDLRADGLHDTAQQFERQADTLAPAQRVYPSKQAALDSGDFNYGAMSGAMLESAIKRGEVKIQPQEDASADPFQESYHVAWVSTAHIAPATLEALNATRTDDLPFWIHATAHGWIVRFDALDACGSVEEEGAAAHWISQQPDILAIRDALYAHGYQGAHLDADGPIITGLNDYDH